MRLPYLLTGLLTVGLYFTVPAQDYVGLSTKEVQRLIQRQTRQRQRPQHVLPPSPGAVEVFSGVLSAATDIRLSCDSLGRCYAEQYLCTTESSALDWLQRILSKKEYEWRPLNQNQQVSNQARQRLVEIYRSEHCWVVQVLRTDWSPLQYQLLFSNKPYPLP